MSGQSPREIAERYLELIGRRSGPAQATTRYPMTCYDAEIVARALVEAEERLERSIDQLRRANALLGLWALHEPIPAGYDALYFVALCQAYNDASGSSVACGETG